MVVIYSHYFPLDIKVSLLLDIFRTNSLNIWRYTINFIFIYLPCVVITISWLLATNLFVFTAWLILGLGSFQWPLRHQNSKIWFQNLEFTTGFWWKRFRSGPENLRRNLKYELSVSLERFGMLLALCSRLWSTYCILHPYHSIFILSPLFGRRCIVVGDLNPRYLR